MRVWLAALVIGCASPAIAGPFAQPGDALFRDDIELMYARGLFRGPIDSWPLPWAQVDRALNDARDGRPLTPELEAAVARVEKVRDWATKDLNIEDTIAVTNKAALARPFEASARAPLDTSARVEVNSGAFTIAAGVGFRPGQRGKSYEFEPSYAAVTFGNWVAYGGYVQEEFGPGEDGALLFSQSSRPFPKVGIKVLDPRTVQQPVLRWLGPLQFEIFGGILDEKRDHTNQAIIGTRLSMSPFRGFTFALNRMQQICGRGNPCSLSDVANSFVGVLKSKGAVSASTQAIGNQIAGLDISYVQRFGRVSAKVYAEAEGEDFSGFILEQWGRIAGVKLSGPYGHRGARWTGGVEYTDTFASRLFDGTPLQFLSGHQLYPGSFYNNGQFSDGYSYFRKPIGYWADGDARVLSGLGSFTDTRNRRWYGSLRSVHLDIGVARPYRISNSDEKFAVVTGGSVWPTKIGDAKLEVRYLTDSPNTPGRRERQLQVEASLRQRF